jgi:hypothetical protein
MSKDAVRIAIGVAALAWVGSEAMKSKRRPKPLGVDVHKLAKQIGKAAEHVEQTSEDVRMLSAQARRLSEKLAA